MQNGIGTHAAMHAQTEEIGRYTVLHPLASGGMASLYLGYLSGEVGFKRLVALKVIHDHLLAEPEFVKMFIDEARLASRISHPNVALTIELGRVGRSHFIAMEYIPGERLLDVLRCGPLSPALAARILADAAAGLHAAHELRDSEGRLLNVVHRDVSPQNILISYEGAVKVVDFGIARARGSIHSSTGGMKGKFSYMSPEQCISPDRVDRRADLFALGIVLYECSTHRRLFRAESEPAVVRLVCEGPITPPSQLVPDFPPALEAIVLRALERDPDRRYQTALELHTDLERFIVGTGEPLSSATVAALMHERFAKEMAEKKRTLSEVEARRRRTRRRRQHRQTMAIAAGALLTLAFGVAMVVALWGAPPSGEPRPASAPTTSKPALREITISAVARPPGAIITLGGERVSNPGLLRRTATVGHADLVITAPGFLTVRRRVPLDVSGAYDVALEPEPRTADGGAPAPSRKKKRGSSGNLTDEDVLSNPYR